jgi:hypothetical protein
MLLIKQIDKANHFIVGYLVYCISCIFLDAYWSIIPVVVIAVLKEIVDNLSNKKFDWYDFAYTIAGLIPSLIIKTI